MDFFSILLNKLLNPSGGSGGGESSVVTKLDMGELQTTLESYTTAPETRGFGNYAFKGFNKLTTVYAYGATTIGNYAFYGCPLTVYTTLGGHPDCYIGPGGSVGDEAFYGCNFSKVICYDVRIGKKAFCKNARLQKVELTYSTNTVSYYNGLSNMISDSPFYECDSLEQIDFINKGYIGPTTLAGCPNIKAVIMRATEVSNQPSVGVVHTGEITSDAYIPDGCYIYIPSKVLDSSSVSAWAAYADKLRAIQDYTVDGSLKGELDPDKI
jgi:hypothetical protein